MQHRLQRARGTTGWLRRLVTMTGGLLLVSSGIVALAAPSSAEGNNGTVKIDGWTLDHGYHDGAPNSNEPHVDCDFSIEWYNYDASVTSTVTFEMQAPTADVGLSGTAPSAVPLDDDDASGANAAGLDGTQAYRLAFDGDPHPEHGYHVKLTVNTPTSNGADVKHKVFWVEGCVEEIPIPDAPAVDDPCGAGNATWQVPGDVQGLLDWTLEDDGDLVVSITAPNTVFADSDGATSKNYGQAPETNTQPCIEEIPVPATPGVDDPCGVGNATWRVPEDVSGQLDWTLEPDGDLVVTILAENTVFAGTDGATSKNYGKAPETNTEDCPVDVIVIPLPEPTSSDACGVAASWDEQEAIEGVVWSLEEDGDLVATITAANTTFPGGATTYNFGQPFEEFPEECEVGGVQLEVPAEPKVKDPCDPGNAAWVVPADTGELDWTLDGETGELSVQILIPDTTFEGTQDTTFNFGAAEETNTEACEVKGEEEEEPDDPTPTVEVKGEQAVVPSAVDAGLQAPIAPQGSPRGPGLVLLGAGLALIATSVPRRRRTAPRR